MADRFIWASWGMHPYHGALTLSAFKALFKFTFYHICLWKVTLMFSLEHYNPRGHIPLTPMSVYIKWVTFRLLGTELHIHNLMYPMIFNGGQWTKS